MMYIFMFYIILLLYIGYIKGDMLGWNYPFPKGHNMMKEYHHSGNIKLTHVHDMSYFFTSYYLPIYLGIFLVTSICAIY